VEVNRLLIELSKHIPKNYGKYIETFIGRNTLFSRFFPYKLLIVNKEKMINMVYTKNRRKLVNMEPTHKINQTEECWKKKF